jgi:hypothetical protein
MAIHYVTIKGHIKDGKLDAELPDNVVDGEAILNVPVVNDQPEHKGGMIDTSTNLDRTLGELLEAGLIGSGADDMKHIGDSAEWVEVTRRKEEEQRTQWKP